MKASQYILFEILESLTKGSDDKLIKYTKRYPLDIELTRIAASHSLSNDVEKTTEKIRKLQTSRKLTTSGGTHIGLKDRRQLGTTEKNKKNTTLDY
jgi:hypothetical protein